MLLSLMASDYEHYFNWKGTMPQGNDAMTTQKRKVKAQLLFLEPWGYNPAFLQLQIKSLPAAYGGLKWDGAGGPDRESWWQTGTLCPGCPGTAGPRCPGTAFHPARLVAPAH